MLCTPPGADKPWYTSMSNYVLLSFLGVGWIQRRALSRNTESAHYDIKKVIN